MNNIWEVVTVTDLIKIIKENPKKFVVVSLVLSDSLIPESNKNNNIQPFIKRHMKDKAKRFPNMTFLFYKVNKKDLGKFSLIDNNLDLYPLVYHIYDINNIFIKVTCAIKDTIIEAFNKGSEYYLKDLEQSINKESVNNSINRDNKSNIEINDFNNQNKQDNNSKPDPDNNLSEWEKQQKIMEEQQKIIARIVNLQQKGKEYNIEILKDIKQRKKEEENIKKK